ncbi:MAG: hypothetical protein U1F56_16395 [Rubrivivax sp.]
MWQVEQLAPSVTLLCSLAGAQVEKPLRWQLSQLAAAVAGTAA